MAARGIKNARIVPKGDRRERQVGPSPFPLLVLALIIALIFLVRLRADEAKTPIAMQSALPEMAR